MKIIIKIPLCILCLFLIFSCSDEQSDQTLIPPESQTDQIQKRKTNNDPFYDLLYVYNTLNIESGRIGTYPFVNDVMATLQNTADSESFYEQLRSDNIFPCWNCAEPEIFTFPNYYIPFYEVNTSQLKGLLIAQEKNNEKIFYYLSKQVVDQIVAVRVEPYSQYYHGIMNYFDLGTYPEDRDEVFASSTLPCVIYEGMFGGPACGCPDLTAEGVPIYHYCHQLDHVNDPNCDTGTCPNLFGGGSNGLEDIPFHDMSDWTSNDGEDPPKGGTNTTGNNNNNNNNNSEPRPDWIENCNSFDGGFSIQMITEGGELVIDESTGTIAIDELEKLYKIQVEKFINQNGLQSQYTPKELMDAVGEVCAVSDVKKVHQCLKCFFINPLGLSSEESWMLSDNFDVVVDCIGDSNPNCIECTFSLNQFLFDSGLELSNSEIDAVLANIDPTQCEATTIGNQVKTVLINLVVVDLGASQLNWLIANFDNYQAVKSFINESEDGITAKAYVNEIISFIMLNPEYDFEYVINNKTELSSDYTETWDNVDGPFADHPIDDFDPDQSPWPNYGPVISKADAVIHKAPYDCHIFAKKQLAKSGYQISSYFSTHVGEGSPNNVVHFETIQVYKEFEDTDYAAIDDGLDYLYSALKRNIPILVGVSTKAGSENPLTDNTTEHFVVIVGMGTDSNGNYFSFYDSGESEIDKVTHSENKFYFNNDKFEGKSNADYANGFTYRLTQIRKSKPPE